MYEIVPLPRLSVSESPEDVSRNIYDETLSTATLSSVSSPRLSIAVVTLGFYSAAQTDVLIQLFCLYSIKFAMLKVWLKTYCSNIQPRKLSDKFSHRWSASAGIPLCYTFYCPHNSTPRDSHCLQNFTFYYIPPSTPFHCPSTFRCPIHSPRHSINFRGIVCAVGDHLRLLYHLRCGTVLLITFVRITRDCFVQCSPL